MNKGSVLIVEDEMLIASHIENCIEEFGFSSAGIAVSYNDAIAILNKKNVDIVLLDINLFGNKSGIDLAKKINKEYKLPHIYLTSYSDTATITDLTKTKPKAYLSKPINETDLTTTLSIVLNNTTKITTINIGKSTYNFNLRDLIYIKSDHVYIELFFEQKKETIRMSMNVILEQFPTNTLVKINRSVAVNPKK